MRRKKKTEPKIPNEFKSHLITIKYLLRTQAMPYLIVDYDKCSLCVLVHRINTYWLCSVIFDIDSELTGVTIAAIQEKGLNKCILDSTKVTIDYSILPEERYYMLLNDLSAIEDIIRSHIHSGDTTFNSDDFKHISHIAHLSKYDTDTWGL